MEKFLKRKSTFNQPHPHCTQETSEQNSKKPHVEIDLESLPHDPGLRLSILSYPPNDRDNIRRKYLQMRPYQPRNLVFPQKKIGNVSRRFNPGWYDDYGSWLEYSISKDASFCLCCYLFKQDNGKKGGGDSFVLEGFNSWNKVDRLRVHVGGPNSAHNQASKRCEDLMNQSQHIQSILLKQSSKARTEYRTRLIASVDCLRLLLRQGLAFRGHNELDESNNRGNFLELLHFLADHNEIINDVVLKNAPNNFKLIAPSIQHEIINAAAAETTKCIIDDLGDDLFSILVDESRDVSNKEQMALVLHYVNKKGSVLERFLGIIHVSDTAAVSLKLAIESLFSKHRLSLSRLRGQGYDGASNMRGEFNGLKSLILKENESAFYVHCFAHQLQLTLVAVARNVDSVASLFLNIGSLLNVVGASCKRCDILRESQYIKALEAIRSGDLKSGSGLNQEMSLKRAGDTRWGSHYGTCLNITILFSSIVEVLDHVAENGLNSDQRVEAQLLLQMIQSFEFVFSLLMMKSVLEITDELSKELQRKDQDIVNAMVLVGLSKKRLQKMRNDEWEPFLFEVSSFCEKHGIVVPRMDEVYVAPGRSRRKATNVLNLKYYRANLFYVVIDRQHQELKNRFTEITSELLLGVACLNPNNSFLEFKKERLIRLAKLYPTDFSRVDILALDSQLQTYIMDMRSNVAFCNVKELVCLAEKLVETNKHIVYPLVFLLVKLALLLPVATASVERGFSAMKIVKSRLRNRMGDSLMNDCLITYIEKDVFDSVDNESIIERFQNMKTRRGQL